MITFNILGDCVSRDILTPLVEGGEAVVYQYVSFASPVSVLSPKSQIELIDSDLLNIKHNFGRRCMIHDFNKTIFDYLSEKKSDYLMLDIVDARMPLARSGNHVFTQSAAYNAVKYDITAKAGSEYENISPFDDINDAEWEQAIAAICSKIRQLYSPDSVIINKHFMVKELFDGKNISMFADRKTLGDSAYKIAYDNVGRREFYCSLQGIQRTNILISRLFKILQKNMVGCHVIEFPENVCADVLHKWGVMPLHYVTSYYEYGAEALRIISKRLPTEQEQKCLFDLKENYSSKIKQEKFKKKTI